MYKKDAVTDLPLSAFVMYSWEEGTNTPNVYAASLCNELRKYNIDATCDIMYNESDTKEKIANHINTTDRFIVIVTPSYVYKADNSISMVGKETEMLL